MDQNNLRNYNFYEKMKHLFAISLCLFALSSFGQNNSPTVSILAIDADELTQELTVAYQVEDLDADECEVWLKFSIDGGTYFEMVAEGDVSGDVGVGILPDEALTLTWDYSALAGNIASTQIRLNVSDNQEVDIAEMVDKVSETELLNFLENIVGERHYDTAPVQLQNVRTYISDAFTEEGLQTEFQDFNFDNTAMQNILGRKPGAKEEGVTIIIDGHFDGVPGSPGADDNGSAVAGVLEALRILSQYDFEHSIRFIGFDAEELGLIGSIDYTNNGITSYEDILGVLNFEMIGYYSDEPDTQILPFGFDLLFTALAQEVADDDFRGNFLLAVGNTDSNPLLTTYLETAATYVPELRLLSASVPGTGTIAPDLRRSDHASFWDAGEQALMLTDGANFRNLNYHTPDDVIETLDFEFMSNVVKATIATAAELAVPISSSFEEVDLSTILSVHNHDHTFPAELVLFPNPSNGLISLQLNNAEQDFRAQLEVFSLDGKAVHKEILTIAAGNSTAQVDLRELPVGTYILNLHSGEAVASAAFVVGAE
ncbi:MAG: M28 family peptidase [Cryomorphaceae bacterium]